jgi:hypothetical protein
MSGKRDLEQIELYQSDTTSLNDQALQPAHSVETEDAQKMVV